MPCRADFRRQADTKRPAEERRTDVSRSTLSLGLFVFVALGTVVRADPPTVDILQRAELIPGVGIFVRVAVNCGDGPTEGTLEVAVRQNEFTSANIDTVTSDGTRQEVLVFIAGVFVPGEASASASLACGLLASGLDLGATIRISE
jgi:hypothetical protein